MSFKLKYFFLIIFLFSVISFSLQQIEDDKEEEEKEEETAIIKPPGFSKISGFYPENFKLRLSAEEDTTIYFTVDASDPRTSKTAKEYTEAILIYDKTQEPNVYANIIANESSPVQYLEVILMVQYTL